MKMPKVRKLYDPYKEQHFANVEDLMALFKDARAHPENYSAKDRETLKRLSREILNKPADPDRPF